MKYFPTRLSSPDDGLTAAQSAFEGPPSVVDMQQGPETLSMRHYFGSAFVGLLLAPGMCSLNIVT